MREIIRRYRYIGKFCTKCGGVVLRTEPHYAKCEDHGFLNSIKKFNSIKKHGNS